MSVRFINRFFTRPGRATVRATVAGLNVGTAMVTVFAAYGGTIDPEVCVLASLAAMALPVMLILGVLLLIVDLIFWRKAAVAIVAGWLTAAAPIHAFAPVNIGGAGSLSEDERQRSFTFLTYNVLHLWDFRGEVEGLERNSTIDAILDIDADIVSLQECDMLREWPLWHVTAGQLKELAARYPFRAVGVDEQFTVLSKYPFTVDRQRNPDYAARHVSFYRISINGGVLHLANCHLQSIGLDPGDKALYKQVLANGGDGDLRQEMVAVKTRLISKLEQAFIHRKRQAEYVRHVVDSIGGNWIVAGDFNDVPSCYAVRTIMDRDMTDAYTEAALGPTITYHDNKFYFRIDQMLYKGDFKAIDITSPRIPSSDHYPLLATFLFDQQDN